MIDGSFDVVGAAGPRHFFEQLTNETLSHGYLFAGPAGVGKKTFALRLAQSLLCVTPKTTLLGYCGICSGCTQVTNGTHPDLYLSEGQVKIGEREAGGFHAAEDATARDLVRQLSMHSYAGGRRVFILGDVDFTREAANALLKFFEEPPPGVLLLLTTTTVARLLPTVRSRLLEVTFPLLSDRDVASVLEREGVEPDVAAHAAQLGGGSVTRARAMLDGEGRILVVSQKTRDQPKNLDDAREKLKALILRALVRPKKRRPTRPSRGAVARRLDEKNRAAKKKKERSGRERGERN